MDTQGWFQRFGIIGGVTTSAVSMCFTTYTEKPKTSTVEEARLHAFYETDAANSWNFTGKVPSSTHEQCDGAYLPKVELSVY